MHNPLRDIFHVQTLADVTKFLLRHGGTDKAPVAQAEKVSASSAQLMAACDIPVTDFSTLSTP